MGFEHFELVGRILKNRIRLTEEINEGYMKRKKFRRELEEVGKTHLSADLSQGCQFVIFLKPVYLRIYVHLLMSLLVCVCLGVDSFAPLFVCLF